jgi:hypothetical protein
MTNHDEEPASLPALVWAVVFTILLVAAVAIFALVASRITTGRATRARHSKSCVGDAGCATSHCSLTRRSEGPLSGAKRTCTIVWLRPHRS